jgi:hypothetical protein
MGNRGIFSQSFVVYLLVGLVVGAGGSYLLTSNILLPRIEDLELQLNDLTVEYESQIGALVDENAGLQDRVSELESEVDEAGERFTRLNTSYSMLLETMGFYDAKNFSMEVLVPLEVIYKGQERRVTTFDVGYGVLIDVEVGLTSYGMQGSDIDIEVSWRRGEQRGFLIGSGNAPVEAVQEATVRVFCEIFDEKSDEMWVKAGAQIVEIPWVKKEGMTVFSIP